jgi:hypothetical protein
MNESEQSLREESSKPRSPKLSAERALPQSGADTLVKIIKGYAVASNGGETQINYKDVASAANLHPTIVSRNNAFLTESQILTSPKYGYYVPSEGAVRFAREAAWDESGAKAHLRRIVSGCWYGQVVIQNLTLNSNLRREDAMKTLAIKSGAAEGDANALDFLIDFIVYTGLVETNENGTLTRGNLDEAPRMHELAPAKDVGELASARAEATVNQVPFGNRERVSVVVHMHIKNLSELSPENAKRIAEWLSSLNCASASAELHVDEAK